MVNKKFSSQSLANLSTLGKIVRDKGEANKSFQTIQVNRIYSKVQPRTIFERLDELAENMKAIGQQQPIVVSPDGTGRYVIEQGERRWRAAKIAQILTLDCIVIKADLNDPQRLIRQLSENIQREEMTLWDLSNSIGLLVSKGMTIRDIASKLGKRESYISVLNAIQDLPKELEELVKNQHIADPVAVRKLQKLFTDDPDVVREQIQRWIDLHDLNESDTPFTITRAQVNAFLKYREQAQAAVDEQDSDSSVSDDQSFVDTSSESEEDQKPTDVTFDDCYIDSIKEEKELRAGELVNTEVELPEGCSAVSPSKVRMNVMWHDNEAFITPGVLSPEGKVCITMTSTKEIYLADATSVVILGVSKI